MKKVFEMRIVEILSRTVAVCGEDVIDAYEKAEELCNVGTIDLNGDDFSQRKIYCDRQTDMNDAKKQYEKIYK